MTACMQKFFELFTKSMSGDVTSMNIDANTCRNICIKCISEIVHEENASNVLEEASSWSQVAARLSPGGELHAAVGSSKVQPVKIQ